MAKTIKGTLALMQRVILSGTSTPDFRNVDPDNAAAMLLFSIGHEAEKNQIGFQAIQRYSGKALDLFFLHVHPGQPNAPAFLIAVKIRRIKSGPKPAVSVTIEVRKPDGDESDWRRIF